ncbi:PaaI family thioesterase [Porphyromonas circumdentaria]|uniref:Uncharacterized domain 1-containing protein n=1 Tax=Porphyromonas circumdentaria TaxID=29524 RepID=A0A1T4PGM9_9PORP|nr:PaaI family thioesterase [Porphyromonas circumdentaria]MBB6275729.1 hypothetical protein [Porphyromonas circumdentaria]MDO4722722.1 PaaI family thioesterase [Porphyromonas circumdentaria]SJZ90649.1 uncharacterized domain 1-containing protein [Porphyromonas circumdentaria]
MTKKELFPEEQGSLLNQLNAHIKGTLMGSLGIEYTSVSDEKIEAVMPVDEHTCQPFGILHGGATLALAETVAGVGSNVLCQDSEWSVGIQVSGNHIASAYKGDKVKAEGVLIHRGRRTHIWRVEVVSVSTGRLISSIQVTNGIISKET